MATVIYAHEDSDYYTPATFLAGPTPRDNGIKSWRQDFLELLPETFTGTILIPEARDGIFKADYQDQVEWEYQNLSNAAKIVFWVDRDLETLPGFTTNVEFGFWIKSGKVIYGRPEGSPKTKYLDWMYEKFTNQKPLNSLNQIIELLVNDPSVNG